jgi:hypothetical protein
MHFGRTKLKPSIYIIEQPFSIGVPRDPRVPRKVARGSAGIVKKSIYKNKHHVFTFTLVCVYINNDH